jgi:hypothetical protein
MTGAVIRKIAADKGFFIRIPAMDSLFLEKLSRSSSTLSQSGCKSPFVPL